MPCGERKKNVHLFAQHAAEFLTGNNGGSTMTHMPASLSLSGKHLFAAVLGVSGVPGVPGVPF